jgi:micrococcal nuclease
LVVLTLLLISGACERTPSDSTDSGSERTRSPTESTASAAPSSVGVQPGLTPAEVTRIVDGDTIEVEIDGQTFKLRYIGIDTPETVDPRRPVQCFGREASERNRQLVEGRAVELERDVSDADQFGRLLRYVWVDGRMVNAALVEEGYATASTYPPDVKYAEVFASLQSQARVASRGLWGAPCESATEAPAAEGMCAYSATGEPVIKGNVSLRTGERIYHVPGGEFYAVTVVDASRGERLFCAEAEAVDAGWRRSMR